MSKNKGIIGIGLILAIVLGIVVVGGGAYYLGTKNNLQSPLSNNPEINGITLISKNESPYDIPAPGASSYLLVKKNIDSNNSMYYYDIYSNATSYINQNKIYYNPSEYNMTIKFGSKISDNPDAFRISVNKEINKNGYAIIASFIDGGPDYINYTLINQNQNLPVTNNQQVNVPTPTIPAVSTGCTSNSSPAITVISPNGGEVFTIGQTINIKWNSKCIDSNKRIFVSIYKKGSQLSQEGSPYGYTTTNTGSYNWIIPKDINSNQYEVNVEYILTNGSAVNDNSDNLFTINSSSISTANWKTYTNSDYGFSFQYPNTWSLNEPSNSINLKGEIMAYEINFNDTATQSVFSLAYHLAPYGAEVYKLAEDDYNSSKNSNEGGTKQITVSGNNAIETLTTMSKDIKGNIYDPALKLIHIVFLDKQKTGSFNLNFRTPEPGSDKEIAKFNQLLSTFKFTN